ncbi:uncharacterized protein ACHE_21089A [Aspergillus chevalieri]|uniref:Uncharacterized protein n=1 Tax=Aspergillus chevalieri TaxID=182096 RepID=A0A7R7VJ43_ASPCH|nr:uncharacterized protein ACHE_21089A [Aspergillus chevalieri]BCR85631.1 hypothetical protein ACHE_21089A [Aspergillus chevalieri]
MIVALFKPAFIHGTARGMPLWMARVSGPAAAPPSLFSLASLFVRFSQCSFFLLHNLLHNSSPIDRSSSSYLSVCIFVLISPTGPYISVFGLLTVVPHPFLSFVCWDLRSPTSHLLPPWLLRIL